MNQPVLPYAAVILKLLGDTLYHDDKEWELLLSYQAQVRQHFASIGLALRIDEAEGYAYLTQPDPNDEENENLDEPLPTLPRLVSRIRFTYEATLLAVLLREELQKFDGRQPGQDRLILSKVQIRQLIQHFYPERADMTRNEARVDSAMRQIERAGFLRPLKNRDEELYEVKRIIKAKLSADKLAEIRQKLLEYAGRNDTSTPPLGGGTE